MKVLTLSIDVKLFSMKPNAGYSILLAVALLLAGFQVNAQSAKDYLKIAQNDLKDQNYREAANRFGKAIQLEPEFERAFTGRAEAYEKLGEFASAGDDWYRAAEISGKKNDFYANAGRNFLKANLLDRAEAALNKAYQQDAKNMDVLQLQTRLYLNKGDFYRAHLAASAAVGQKRTLINTYWLGVVSDSLGNYDEAVASFEEILKGNNLFEDAYPGIVSARLKRFERHQSSYLRSEELEKAYETARTGLEIFPDNVSLRVLRSQIYFHRFEFSKAIDDISRAIAVSGDSPELSMLRGSYFQTFGQHQNAIGDYTRVIGANPLNAKAYYQRGLASEAIFNHNQALSDFEEALSLIANDNNEVRKKEYRAARDRILELHRESDPPRIVLHHPAVGADGVIRIRMDVDSLTINGIINDQSRIKHIRLNGHNLAFDRKQLNPEFTHELALSDISEIQLTTSDWYDNTASVSFDIVRNEIDPPLIHVTEPFVAGERELIIDEDVVLLTVRGHITDESHIKSILVEGVTASYPIDRLNPRFTAHVDISNKDHITITATDVHGNERAERFKLRRQAAAFAGINPMGKTWVVFIENSRYQSLASIDGPEKDVSNLQRALGDYHIDKVLHKKNMSKADMERFFSIELRDLVRGNRVNSLLVWYSGHGKQLNETGYWFPVDARRDDEFSYFNINTLKAGMQSYSKELTHTLVVTDACDAGPSFADVTRDDLTIRRCEDWEATRLRSSQVLSSSGYELATGNSPLAQTFVNLLNQTSDACVPIEAVVLKMKEQGSRTGSIPKLGIISGFGHENGTFFFVKEGTN
ncbi:MAG: hypothetical protein EA392_06325 [Cryomorphaceae bacterium]|nr:MAG: hypothetical protein EA392_06325 [Cryomorphaceae bacterium]